MAKDRDVPRPRAFPPRGMVLVPLQNITILMSQGPRPAAERPQNFCLSPTLNPVAACTWIGSSTRRWSRKSSIPTSYAPMSGPRRVGYHGPKTQRDPSGTLRAAPFAMTSRCGLALVQSPAFISELHYAHNSDSADARAVCSGVPPARAGHPPSPPWCQCDRWAN